MGKRDESYQSHAYGVGFAKPPQHMQFRKGASGNPKGRPTGSKSMASILTKVGRERVKVTVNGKTRSITKHEAYIMQLSNRAANGDLKAGRDLMTALRLFPESPELMEVPSVPTERDEVVLKNLFDRLRSCGTEPESSNAPRLNECASESPENE